MGVVYLAEHLRLQQNRAIKLLPPEMAEDEGFRQRFERESRMAASLEHPNIDPIHDAGEVDGLLYISMRYIDGYDLKKLIEREGALHPDRTVSLLEQVASALDEAHSAGLIHRDVKPQNTLVSPPRGSRTVERAYLTDFGLTKQYGSKTGVTAAGTMLGTVDYMAPEQLEAKDVDARADIYALACVLYECLSGAVPFDRPTMASVMMAHMSEAPPRVTALNEKLPAGLNDVISKGMAKAREDRYPSCGELIDAARDVIASAGATTGAAPAAAAWPGTVVAPGGREDLAPGEQSSGEHAGVAGGAWPAQGPGDPGQQGWAAGASQQSSGQHQGPPDGGWQQQGQGSWPGQGQQSDPNQTWAPQQGQQGWSGQSSDPQTSWPPQQEQPTPWPQQSSGGYQQPGWSGQQPKKKGGIPPWGIGALVGGVALLLVIFIVVLIAGGGDEDNGVEENGGDDNGGGEVTTSFSARSVTTFPDDINELLPANLDGVPDADLDPGVVCSGNSNQTAGRTYIDAEDIIRVVICRYSSAEEAVTDLDNTIGNQQGAGFELVGDKEPIVDEDGAQIGEGARMTNPQVEDLADVELVTWTNNEISVLVTIQEPTPAGLAEEVFNSLDF